MALPIVTAVLKNIKVFSIALLIGGVIASGAGLYFHGKKVERLQSQIELLQAEAETERIVRAIVDDAAEQHLEERQVISQARSDATQQLQEVKKQDEDVADYLNADIPDGVLTIRDRARCISLPYTCSSDARE